MTFHDCYDQLAELMVFTWQDLYLIDPTFRKATLYDWQKSGKVIRLKRNRYIFAQKNLQNWDYYLISNRLYQPSYVSFEMALSHYGVIPEVTTQITAATTNKTATFTNQIGTFAYRSLKPSLFFGYDLLPVRNQRVKLATLEKTLLDYLYRNSHITSPASFDGLRWNPIVLLESIDYNRLNQFASVFSDSSLNRRLIYLNQYLKQ